VILIFTTANEFHEHEKEKQRIPCAARKNMAAKKSCKINFNATKNAKE
jgi:hypothetical protein